MMVLEVEGEEKNFDKGTAYLQEIGVAIENIDQDISKDEV